MASVITRCLRSSLSTTSLPRVRPLWRLQARRHDLHTTSRLAEEKKPVLFDGRDPKTVIQECDVILQIRPKEHRALIDKAIALHSMGHWLEAFAVGTAAQELAPPEAQATLHMLLGECLFQTGKVQEALEECDKALAKGATVNGATGLRAHCLYLLGKDEEALEATEQACKEQPENGHLHFLRGMLLHATGNLQDALGALNRASRYAPDNAAVHLERARVLRGLADREAAKAALEKSLHLDPSSPLTHNIMGIILSEDGDMEGALKSFETAVSLDPNDPSVISNKGKCLHRMQRHEEAVTVFRQALGLGASEGFGVHVSLGECLCMLGRFEEAVESLTEAVKQQPEDGKGQALLAFALRALNRLDEALQAIEKACELESDHANWHAIRGQLLHTQSRTDDALAALERSLQLDCKTTDAADVYYSRGMIRGGRGDVPEAIADFDSALKLNDRHLHANTKKALWLDDQGRGEEAMKIWDKLVEQGQADCRTLTNRGKTLARLSRPDEAKEAFQKAIARGDGDSEPHKALGALLWGRGLRKEAYDAWCQGSIANPTDVMCYFLQGVYLSESGDPEQALVALDKALKYSNPPLPEALELRNQVSAALMATDKT